MKGVISYKLIEGEYVLAEYGVGVDVYEDVDVIIPVEEHIAIQADKFHFDGEKLKLKSGKILYSLELLKAEEEAHDINNGALNIYD